MEFTLDRPWGQAGVCLVRYSRHADDRGEFCEWYRATAASELGLPGEFVQDCWSRSRRGVLRGMHFQRDPLMGKMIRVVRGRACLIAVDVRPQSASFRTAYPVELGEDDLTWVWAPGWFARGYLALADTTEVLYKCTAEYNPRTEAAVRWDDPALASLWPTAAPILSERDQRAPTIDEALLAGALNFEVVAA